MNIEQANAVPIILLLEKLNIKPVKIRRYEARFLSPLRAENTASFDVNLKRNCWFDHGTGEGGDCVAFVCKFLESQKEDHTVADALRWIGNMSGQSPLIKPIEHSTPDQDSESSKALAITEIQTIRERTLEQYLASRGIPLKLAQKYLKEIRLYNRNTKKHFYALGFKNEDEGYELRNKYFKGCIGSKDITFIRGKNPQSKSVHIFEGMMDFLSAVFNESHWAFEGDAIVLNSVSILTKATPYIKGYGYRAAYTWLDNDDAGIKATKALKAFFETEEGLLHHPQNHLYAPHKDVNAWHMHTLGL